MWSVHICGPIPSVVLVVSSVRGGRPSSCEANPPCENVLNGGKQGRSNAKANKRRVAARCGPLTLSVRCLAQTSVCRLSVSLATVSNSLLSRHGLQRCRGFITFQRRQRHDHAVRSLSKDAVREARRRRSWRIDRLCRISPRGTPKVGTSTSGYKSSGDEAAAEPLDGGACS